MRKYRAGVAAIVVGLIGWITPAASAKTGLVTQPCGSVLTARGYDLLAVTTSCASDGITIHGSHITLDLGGRVLQGDGPANVHTGIRVLSGSDHIVVKNGTILNFYIGVASLNGGVTFSNLVVRGTDTPFDIDGDAVSNSFAVRNKHGMAVGGDAHVMRNVVTATETAGLEMLGSDQVTGNKLLANGGSGIIGSNSDRISRNVVAGNSSIGVVAGGTQSSGILDRNTVIGNGGAGVSIGSVHSHGNKIIGNANEGAIIAGHAKLDGNVVNGNGFSGFAAMASGARLLHNTADGNGEHGIGAANGNAIIGNTLDGNVVQGVSIGTPTAGKGTNHASENGGDPIQHHQCDPSNLCKPDTSQKGIPTFIDCTASTLVLGDPGVYRLARSVHDCPLNQAVNITASNVTFDLAGRRIDGNPVGLFPIAISVAAGVHHVVIRNGTISGYFFGVAAGAGDVTISHVTATANTVGVGAQDGTKITHCDLIANSNGASLNGGSSLVSSLVTANTGNGIAVSGADNAVRSSTIAGNGSNGIESQNDTNTFTGNLIVGNATDGLKATASNTIKNNHIIGNLSHGIEADASNTIDRNLIIGNGGDGITLNGFNNTISKNVVNGNALGVKVSSINTITGNTINGNLGDGLDSIEENLIKNNTANGNAGKGIYAALGAAEHSGNNHAKLNAGTQCDPASLCV